jgi:hypothetical protein
MVHSRNDIVPAQGPGPIALTVAEARKSFSRGNDRGAQVVTPSRPGDRYVVILHAVGHIANVEIPAGVFNLTFRIIRPVQD